MPVPGSDALIYETVVLDCSSYGMISADQVVQICRTIEDVLHQYEEHVIGEAVTSVTHRQAGEYLRITDGEPPHPIMIGITTSPVAFPQYKLIITTLIDQILREIEN